MDWPNHPAQNKLLIVALAGLMLSSVLTLGLVMKKSSQVSSVSAISSTTGFHNQAPIKQETKVVLGSPVRLRIPTINVNAALDYVSLTSTGELGVPAGPTDAAWYDRGPLPGQTGAAVIDGHFGWVHNIPAVFDNLHKLQPGDIIYVDDDRGVATSFVVRALQMYDQNASEAGVFTSADGKAHLNLITCQGAWSQSQESYSSRLVVFSDKET